MPLYLRNAGKLFAGKHLQEPRARTFVERDRCQEHQNGGSIKVCQLGCPTRNWDVRGGFLTR